MFGEQKTGNHVLFDFETLGTLERYKVLSFTVVPRPIAWVVTVGRDGTRNAAPFSFFNVLCTDPPIIAVGFTARSPRGKDTPRHIEETGQFVVNLVPFALMNAMNITGIEFDHTVDELVEARLSVLPSAKVTPPRIAESPVALECEKFQLVKMDTGQSIVLGRVIAAHVTENAVIDAGKCYIDTLKLDLVGRMNNKYIRADEAIELPRISVAEWRVARERA